jgi:tight adherence protein B
MMMIGIAALVGLAATLLLLGGKAWVMRRFNGHVDWVRDTALRFHPYPIQAERWTLMGYALLVGIFIILLFISPHPLIAVGFWLVLLLLPKIIVEMVWKRRRAQIDQQIPAAVAALANSLKAGLTLVQALQRLADSAPEPIRTDFRVIVNRYAYGANLEETVKEAKARLKLANFNLFASALLINREMGGDISETLFRISQSLDKLQQMRKTVEAHTSEGRTNIKIILVAPVLLLLMMATVDSEGVMLLFNSAQGWAVLVMAGIFIGAGVFFASMITKSEI